MPLEAIDSESQALLVEAKTKSEQSSRKKAEEATKRYYFLLATKGMKVKKLSIVDFNKSMKVATIKSSIRTERTALKNACRDGGVSGVAISFGRVLCDQTRIVFQLDPADGFKKAPCNLFLLKDFLNNNGRVDYTDVELQIVEDRDEVSTVETPDEEVKLRERINVLKDNISEIIQKTGDAQLQNLVESTVGLAKAKDLEQAHAKLDNAEKRMKFLFFEDYGEPSFDWPKIKGVWQPASNAVDRQINRLSDRLKEFGNEINDEELIEIAEFELDKITGAYRTSLVSQIIEVDNTKGIIRSNALREVLDTVKEFYEFILLSERVTAVDDDMFEIGMNVRSTLTRALIVMEQAIESIFES